MQQNIPNFGRDTNDRIEMAIQVEITEEAFDTDAIDSEGHLGYAKVKGTADHITLLERLLGCAHTLWFASCKNTSND